MFAIVESGGKQYRVEPGQRVVVDHLHAEEGATVEIDRVLLVEDGALKVGTPVVAGARVTARVVEHFKGEKVVTFKYRRRHRSKRRVGSRHLHTALEITGIQA